MAEVGLQTALQVSRDYLNSLNLDPAELDIMLDEAAFDGGFVQVLTDAGVINRNKSENTTAKTTHIHITGDSRYLLYTDDQLNTEGGLDDEKIEVELLNANLAHLKFLGNEREIDSFQFADSVRYILTYTFKKISSRGRQVQISKLRSDGEAFVRLRESLYPDDLLVVLKYAHKQNTYLMLGIPARDFAPDIRKSGRKLSTTQADEIGAYSINQDRDREIAAHVDLTTATEKRLDRSMRHQKLLRVVARQLAAAEYELYEGMIDCLAKKSATEVLIFEMKTLDGTPTDEMNQVRDALGQLLYYEHLQSGQFADANKMKIACFEGPITEQHKEFLNINGCYVIWLDQHDHIVGNQEILDKIK